jgi:GT2 family glycosyltransferase
MSVRSLLDPRSVTIIIPQFNQPHLTIQSIRTLRQTDTVAWSILVVDNGSTPDSLRQLHQLSDSGVEIISLPHAGLTAAWNTAAKHCSSSSLIFLNNDTVSLGPWVETLVSPVVQGTTRMTGVALRRESNVTKPVELLSGWCFAVQRQTFNAVHGFDAAMALYFSDTDLQLRVRDNSSLSPASAWKVVPGLPITHLSHRTAHQLPNQKSQWRADREKFLARWQECR